ncbi:PASTA domain-containing protein [Leifsonia sp. L25]|uniref:PASTA domain-containing protein n=1 Tax=Actinomycetes TaxID=1760 RepID=UPI003D695A60
MTHAKRRWNGLTTGAVALLLVLGGVTACSAGDAPAGQNPSAASDAAATSTPTPSATPTPPPVVTANHVGETSEQALAELTEQGLLVSFADTSGQVLTSQQGWFVVGQDPPAGASVPEGSWVKLILRAPVVTASHVGETSDQATAELTQQGLQVSFADTSGQALTSQQGWSVVGQDPPAGTSLRAGSSVKLILSPPAPPAPPAPAPPADTGSGSSSGSEQAVPPGGPTAKCNDGTLSYSAHHQGTCSHHGGVAVWYK